MDEAGDQGGFYDRLEGQEDDDDPKGEADIDGIG